MAVRDRDIKLLMRYVAGELDEAARRRLKERLDEDEQLRAALRQLRSTWSALSPPIGEPKVPDQTSRILSEIRRRRERDPGVAGWFAAPVWIKAGSLASLAVGLVMGLLVSTSGFGPPPEVSEPSADGDLFLAAEPTSADLYWRALEASSGGLGDEQENGT